MEGARSSSLLSVFYWLLSDKQAGTLLEEDSAFQNDEMKRCLEIL